MGTWNGEESFFIFWDGQLLLFLYSVGFILGRIYSLGKGMHGFFGTVTIFPTRD